MASILDRLKRIGAGGSSVTEARQTPAPIEEKSITKAMVTPSMKSVDPFKTEYAHLFKDQYKDPGAGFLLSPITASRPSGTPTERPFQDMPGRPPVDTLSIQPNVPSPQVALPSGLMRDETVNRPEMPSPMLPERRTVTPEFGGTNQIPLAPPPVPDMNVPPSRGLMGMPELPARRALPPRPAGLMSPPPRPSIPQVPLIDQTIDELLNKTLMSIQPYTPDRGLFTGELPMPGIPEYDPGERGGPIDVDWENMPMPYGPDITDEEVDYYFNNIRNR